jgi:hypothetical protein
MATTGRPNSFPRLIAFSIALFEALEPSTGAIILLKSLYNHKPPIFFLSNNFKK